MSKILVAGGSGFLGTALIGRLISMGKTNITSLARNEGNQVILKEKYPNIEIIIGDIADKWAVKKAMKNMDEVYLLSAMKHVGLAEAQVNSCITTNVVGTKNIIEEAFITKPKILIFISSDKASQPSGVYGCSKKIGEKLMEEAEKINTDTKFRVVRYGNVLYSTGSVLCKWRDKMIKGEEVIVTDMDATRFFWPIDKALDLIFECMDNATNSKPFIPEMKSIRIGDLLEAMMEVYGRVSVKITGLQNGENKHEVISENGCNSYDCEKYTREEILQLI